MHTYANIFAVHIFGVKCCFQAQDSMLTLSKTTFPPKLFPSDCTTLYLVYLDICDRVESRQRIKISDRESIWWVVDHHRLESLYICKVSFLYKGDRKSTFLVVNCFLYYNDLSEVVYKKTKIVSFKI